MVINDSWYCWYNGNDDNNSWKVIKSLYINWCVSLACVCIQPIGLNEDNKSCDSIASLFKDKETYWYWPNCGIIIIDLIWYL